jgi:signal transduction histidine kinase
LLSGVAGQNTPRQKEFLEIIQSNSDRLLTLINELLDVSKMTSGSFSIQKADYDVIKVIDSSIKDITSITEKKKISIVKETTFKSLNMKIDEYRISQAIINLLNNAIKFSREGSKIIIRLDEYSDEKFRLPNGIKTCLPSDGKYVVVSISDEGVGLTPEQKQRVFNRFYQAEDINTRTAQGTGLGLFIVKNIVELHSGFVWVDSEGKGKGTTFYMLLPRE